MNLYYDARAPWHDQYMSYKSNRDMEKLLAPIIATFENMISGKSVLEIACGTGNWTQVLAKRAAFVTAVDISPRALTKAREKLAGYNNVTFMLGDAYSLDNITDCFCVVFAADWWSHIPKKAISPFLQSIKRKSCSSSTAIFIDMLFDEHFRQFPFYFDEDNNQISRRTLPDGSEFTVVKNFPNEFELREILGDYGRVLNYYEFSSLKRWMVIVQDSY